MGEVALSLCKAQRTLHQPSALHTLSLALSFAPKSSSAGSLAVPNRRLLDGAGAAGATAAASASAAAGAGTTAATALPTVIPVSPLLASHPFLAWILAHKKIGECRLGSCRAAWSQWPSCRRAHSAFKFLALLAVAVPVPVPVPVPAPVPVPSPSPVPVPTPVPTVSAAPTVSAVSSSPVEAGVCLMHACFA